LTTVHLHLHLLVDLHHLARVADPAPRHVGDVEQAVDAAEIDERAEVGDIFHDATAHLAHLEQLHELLLPLGPLLLDERPAGDDDVAPRLVDLEHEALDRPAAVVADVGGAADIDLARGEKHVHPRNVDEQSALDLAGDVAGDDVIFLDALHHAQPVFDPARLPLGERDQAPLLLLLAVFELLEQHLHGVAHLRSRLPIVPLVARDVALALVAHVDEHELVVHPQHLPHQHRIHGERGGAHRIFAGFGAGHGEFEFLGEFVSEFEFADEVAVDHACGVSGANKVRGMGYSGHDREVRECNRPFLTEQSSVLPRPIRSILPLCVPSGCSALP
jgi:hypothetical protein